TPPPGVADEAGRREAGFQLGAVQINERSMRVLARGLDAGERAEAYLRFTTEGDKKFLKYQSLHAWARGRGPGWEDGDLEFFIKAGKDQNNFYLYHTPARTISWEPEVRVSFDRWLALRARIEQAWLRGDTAQIYPGCPDSTLLVPDSSFVMCDGPYIVHVRDPSTAPPNLAGVQEIAAGIWRVNANVFIDQAEVWVDDIRLANVVQETGLAGALDVSLTAADVADLAVSLLRRDGQFRQLGQDPSYVTDNAASIAGTVRFDRFLPRAWSVAIPITLSRTVAASDPFYLTNTDIRADALPGLRRPHATSSSYTFFARRIRRSTRSVSRWLIDPLSISGVFNTGRSRSELAQASGSNYGFNLDYTLLPGPRTVRIVGANLRINPSALAVRSGFAGSDAQRFTFTVPIPRSDDTLPPSLSNTRFWRNSGRLDLLPLTGFQLSVEAASTRDLRDYGDSTTMGRLLGQERETFLGMDVGVETQRSLTSSLNLTPRIGAWIRPRFTAVSGFTFSRDANARQPIRTEGDSAGEFRVPAAFTNSRRFDLGAQLDVGRLAKAIFGDSSGAGMWLARIAPIDVSYGRQRGSSYNLATDAPALGYRLGLGGIEDFRSVNGQLATSAVQNTIITAGGGVSPGLGLRVTATYRRTNNVAWTLRADEQVPLRSQIQDWPSGQIAWSVTPPKQNIGRVIPRILAQVTYRKSQTANEQPTFEAGSSVITRTTDEALNPSVSLTLVGGLLLTTDWARSHGDRLAAGSLFRSERNAHNTSLTFSFRPPGASSRWRNVIRTTAGYNLLANTTCLRGAGQTTCVPYVD
ncbi:MAG: hypothetical protein ACRET3_07500, partial [Burkholderiales bacterium]